MMHHRPTAEKDGLSTVEDVDGLLRGDDLDQLETSQARRPVLFRWLVAVSVAFVALLVWIVVIATSSNATGGAVSSDIQDALSSMNGGVDDIVDDMINDVDRGDTTSITSTLAPSPLPSTTPPTNEPSVAPSTPPTTITLGCLPDRFDNEAMDLTVDPEVNFNRLYPGQFICSKPYKKPTSTKPHPQRYQFGVTDSGDVVYMDTVDKKTKTLFQNNDNHDVYFSLRIDATMVVQRSDTNEIVWEQPPVHIDNPMSHTPRCLSNHDCPYYHIHSDGVLVLNWIGADGSGWQAKNVLRVYGYK